MEKKEKEKHRQLCLKTLNKERLVARNNNEHAVQKQKKCTVTIEQQMNAGPLQMQSPSRCGLKRAICISRPSTGVRKVTMFGSTHKSQAVFSVVNIINTKYCFRLISELLLMRIRMALIQAWFKNSL